MRDYQNGQSLDKSRVTVVGRHVDVGDALRAHVSDRIQTTAKKYAHRAVDATVILSRASKGIRFSCHISIRAGSGVFHESDGEAPLASEAFGQALEHVARQLRRLKRATRDDKPAKPANQAKTDA